MGRKERKEREIKRENYATKHSAEKRKQTLISIGVLAVIGVIVIVTYLPIFHFGEALAN